MSVKLKVAILALFLFVQNSIAVKDDGTCTIDNVSDDDFKGALVLDGPVKKTDPPKQAIPNKEGIIYKGNDVTDVKCKEKCYINADYKDSTITFIVGEEMSKVDEYPFTDNIFKVETLFEITCSDGKTKQLRVQIPVTDVNVNAPKFNIKDNTEITFPVPVATSTYLTWYTTEIIVTDKDFSNKGITVTTDNSDVEVGYLTPEEKKVSISLKFKKIYNIREELTLKLTATDEPGNDDKPKPTTITLILKPDLENSPLPKFQKHKYECEFKNEKLTETIQLEGKTGANVKASVTDENKLFTATLNEDQKTVDIKRTENDIKVESTVLTLQIKRDDFIEETKLLVKFVHEDTNTIKFTKNIYNYINDEAKTISPKKFFEPVSLTKKLEGVEFLVTPGDGITATLNKDGLSVDFQITEDFQKKHKDEKLVELTLKAYKGDIKAETAVIVEIPNNLFKQPSYTLTYKSKSKSVTGDISTNSDVTGMKFTLSNSEGKDDKNFIISPSGTSVKISLTKDKFVSYPSNVFTLTLSATSGGKAIAEAEVLVELPENSFSKTNYIAVYSESDKKIYGVDFISNELDVPPEIDDAELTKTFELKQHQKKSKLTGFPQSHFIKLFEKFNQGEMDKFLYKYMADEVKEFELSSKTDLSKNLPQGTNLTIPIKAKAGYSLAQSVVTLILPMAAQKLQFSKPSYELEYTVKDSKGVLTSVDIALTADIKSETKCTLEGDYYDSFKCSVDKTKKTYKIELAKEKIDFKKEDAVKNHISLVLRDEVLLKDIPVNVQTSLIVNLKEVPKVEEEECSHTTWIIVTVIMAIVLVAYVVASLIYHKSKLRSAGGNRRYQLNNQRNGVRFSEGSNNAFENSFEKKITRDSLGLRKKKSSSIATRRPTGWVKGEDKLED